MHGGMQATSPTSSVYTAHVQMALVGVGQCGLMAADLVRWRAQASVRRPLAPQRDVEAVRGLEECASQVGGRGLRTLQRAASTLKSARLSTILTAL